MEITSDLYSLNFTGKLMELLFQMVFNLVMADEARLSLVLISFVELLSLHKVDSRYLKLSTSSSCCPFSMMLVAAC